MTGKSTRSLIGACLLLSMSSSEASFHLWDITEVYSNADGTVQFIELETSSSGQHLLAAHTLVADSDGLLVSMAFTNLPSSATNGRKMLIATPGFGLLAGGVEPDYTIPAGFIDPGATAISLNFAEGTDVFAFTGSDLPNDGTSALLRNLSSAFNTPENFSAETGQLTLPPVHADGFEEISCEGKPRSCFVMPFNGAAAPASIELHSGDSPVPMDVYVLLDRSGSMASEVLTIVNSLSGIAQNLTCAPLGSGAEGSCVESLWWGSGTIGFSGVNGNPFVHHVDLQPSVVTAANGIDTSVQNDGCCAEATSLAIHSVITGEGSATTICEVAAGYPGRADCDTSAAGADGFGYGCFRSAALPVVAVFTDEAPSDSLDCPGLVTLGSTAPNQGVRIVGIVGSAATPQTTTDLTILAQSSGAVDNQGQALVLDGSDAAAAAALQSALLSLAIQPPLDISVEVIDNPADAVDVNAAFIDHIETVQSGTAFCSDGLTDTDTNGDSAPDTFVDVAPGTSLCFAIITQNNSTVAPQPKNQVYRATAKILAEGSTLIDSLPLLFIVPAE